MKRLSVLIVTIMLFLSATSCSAYAVDVVVKFKDGNNYIGDFHHYMDPGWSVVRQRGHIDILYSEEEGNKLGLHASDRIKELVGIHDEQIEPGRVYTVRKLTGGNYEYFFASGGEPIIVHITGADVDVMAPDSEDFPITQNLRKCKEQEEFDTKLVSMTLRKKAVVMTASTYTAQKYVKETPPRSVIVYFHNVPTDNGKMVSEAEFCHFHDSPEHLINNATSGVVSCVGSVDELVAVMPQMAAKVGELLESKTGVFKPGCLYYISIGVGAQRMWFEAKGGKAPNRLDVFLGEDGSSLKIGGVVPRVEDDLNNTPINQHTVDMDKSFKIFGVRSYY